MNNDDIGCLKRDMLGYMLSRKRNAPAPWFTQDNAVEMAIGGTHASSSCFPPPMREHLWQAALAVGPTRSSEPFLVLRGLSSGTSMKSQ